jgi:hypothetical protein
LHRTTHHVVDVDFSGKNIVDKEAKGLRVSRLTFALANVASCSKNIAIYCWVGLINGAGGLPAGEPIAVAPTHLAPRREIFSYQWPQNNARAVET